MSEDLLMSTSSQNDYASTAKSALRSSHSATSSDDKQKAESSASTSEENIAIESKSDSQILTELKMNGSVSSVTAQQLSTKYDISVDRATRIIEQFKKNAEQIEYDVISGLSNSYSYTMNTHPDEDYTTVSYSV